MQLTSSHRGEDFCALRFGERDRNMHDDVKAELNGLDQDSDHLERDSSTFKAELVTLKEERDDSKAARDLSEREFIDWIDLCADLCPIAARADDLKQEIDGLKQENTLLDEHIAVTKSQYDELMDLLRMTVQLMAENEAREAGGSSLHDPECPSSTPMAPSRDDGSSAMDQSPASHSSISPADLQVGI
ncbi:uncharacterized protein SCHCODRAFT_02677151 [Schizophyllum commune H4-8]|uniref:Uncharacterized protein n=1 Tax=Schizophyllum commune (strain H4-8 / FGSC 9210) TaxID=578458 RepID=D8Q1T8_SCHCM|nr:uncharacterized protein SCHCODRAFT_02677151 [Schizophyllum commune H4-8]KAI5895564.1 hypothetical protein SCHCODRAFT_02677151 [Schizophyllum commune H4-8]